MDAVLSPSLVDESFLPPKVFFGLQQNLVPLIEHSYCGHYLTSAANSALWHWRYKDDDGYQWKQLCPSLHNPSFVLGRFMLAIDSWQRMTHEVRVVAEQVFANPSSGLLWPSADGRLEHFHSRVRSMCGSAFKYGSEAIDLIIRSFGRIVEELLRERERPFHQIRKGLINEDIIPPDPRGAACFDEMTTLQVMAFVVALRDIWRAMITKRQKVIGV
jgi:hypothetical protein